jgi:hypothetical protein
MPELLEESIAEVKEQTAHVADTVESSGSAVANETQTEPVIECRESTAESSDKLEALVLPGSVSENAMVDDSVAVVDEPVAVLDEPVAVLEEPTAVGFEETSAVHDEPGAEHAAFQCTSEALVLADEPIESPAIGEPAVVLAEPIAEVADLCSVEAAAEANVVADQVTESHDEAAPVDEAAGLA